MKIRTTQPRSDKLTNMPKQKTHAAVVRRFKVSPVIHPKTNPGRINSGRLKKK